MSTLLEVFVPGKAFLAGEYLAMSGGPALIAAVGPQFVLKVLSSGESDFHFHPESPAGKLLESCSDRVSGYSLKFEDPHEGKGGWGGSTAEFAASYALCHSKTESWDLLKVLSEYRTLAAGKGVQQPSGADLLGQIQGGLTLFDRNANKLESCSWPFADLGFLLAKTPTKVATHQHLQSLGEFSTAELSSAMKDIELSLQNKKSEVFVQGIRKYADALSTLGFVAATTQEILQSLRHPSVLAAKGCGAMGADVVAVFFSKIDAQNRKTVTTLLENSKCVVVADDESLSKGITVKGQLC